MYNQARYKSHAKTIKGIIDVRYTAVYAPISQAANQGTIAPNFNASEVEQACEKAYDEAYKLARENGKTGYTPQMAGRRAAKQVADGFGAKFFHSVIHHFEWVDRRSEADFNEYLRNIATRNEAKAFLDNLRAEGLYFNGDVLDVAFDFSPQLASQKASSTSILGNMLRHLNLKAEDLSNITDETVNKVRNILNRDLSLMESAAREAKSLLNPKTETAETVTVTSGQDPFAEMEEDEDTEYLDESESKDLKGLAERILRTLRVAAECLGLIPSRSEDFVPELNYAEIFYNTLTLAELQ